MKILIVDDEAHARQRLRRLLSELQADYEVVGEAADGEQALGICDDRDVDLVLLDIRVPGMDGLEVAARLAELEPPPAVILVTAYAEHALDAFGRGVDDYLVKPVRRERLQAALQRVRVPNRPQREAMREPRAAPHQRRLRLSAHYRGGLQSVPIDQVIYLQAEQKYVTVYHTQGQLLVDESLKSLEEEFADLFMRIHRNALVARRRMAGLQRAADRGYLMCLRGCDERLPISRRHLAEVRRWLQLGVE